MTHLEHRSSRGLLYSSMVVPWPSRDIQKAFPGCSWPKWRVSWDCATQAGGPRTQSVAATPLHGRLLRRYRDCMQVSPSQLQRPGRAPQCYASSHQQFHKNCPTATITAQTSALSVVPCNWKPFAAWDYLDCEPGPVWTGNRMLVPLERPAVQHVCLRKLPEARLAGSMKFNSTAMQCYNRVVLPVWNIYRVRARKLPGSDTAAVR